MGLPGLVDNNVGTVPTTESKVKLDLSKFKDLFSLHANKELSDLQRDIRESESDIAEARQAHLRIIMSHEILVKRAAVLNESMASGFASKIETSTKYLEGLMDAGLYTNFKLTASSKIIIGITSKIVLTHGYKEYILGPFEVSVDFSTATINIFSLGQHNEVGYGHPHVSSPSHSGRPGGTPCLGNISQDIPVLIMNGDLGVIFEIVHKFLSSYNKNNPYRQIETFKSDTILPPKPKIVEPVPAEVAGPVSPALPVPMTGWTARAVAQGTSEREPATSNFPGLPSAVAEVFNEVGLLRGMLTPSVRKKLLERAATWSALPSERRAYLIAHYRNWALRRVALYADHPTVYGTSALRASSARR
jgi:hypothetical protein